MSERPSSPTWEPDLPHPIIERPHEYDIADFRYHVGMDGTEPFIDMTLQRASVVRRLRFFSPQQLIIEEGFPSPTRGMAIYDVSRRQLERSRVRVADEEASYGAVTFWAREVVDLDVSEVADL